MLRCVCVGWGGGWGGGGGEVVYVVKSLQEGYQESLLLLLWELGVGVRYGIYAGLAGGGSGASSSGVAVKTFCTPAV